MRFQTEKSLIRDFYTALDGVVEGDAAPLLAQFYAPNLRWRGFHPFGEITGAETVAARFWNPLKQSLRGMQRRMDMFFAGQNVLDDPGGIWVASAGHLMGLFDHPWLGIAPTGRLVMLPYAAFHRVEAGQIVDEAMYFDIPHLMIQAGQNPFPPQTGAHLVQPGPATQDGLLFEAQPEAEGHRTLAAIEHMVSDLGRWDSGLPLEEELARSWHHDMLWWGPAGIGATYTIPRYARQHSGPFRAAFTDRSPTRHICRMAEGHYGGFFGWPNFSARHRGGFMGMPGSEHPGAFRVIDMYRREGDKLKENWVYIDLLHFWHAQGVDILARNAGLQSLED